MDSPTGMSRILLSFPNFRKKGIGKEIVAALVRKCRDAGISWLGLIAEPGTEPFYHPLGFEPMQGYIPLLWKSDR